MNKTKKTTANINRHVHALPSPDKASTVQLSDKLSVIDTKATTRAPASANVKNSKNIQSVDMDCVPDFVCLSHLRWDFVTQRPQHLMVRAAQQGRVFFVEEPVFEDGMAAAAAAVPRLEVRERDSSNVWVVVPHLPSGLDAQTVVSQQRKLLTMLFDEQNIESYVLWYYTPMAMSWFDASEVLPPLVTVYDCMDELSAFKYAPAEIKNLEAALLKQADLVFTGGHSLYEAKRTQHSDAHPFPSSVDAAHFAKARRVIVDPKDQAGIPHPRLGFFGVIDERMDLELLQGVAAAQPDWQLVMVGPVVKIDRAVLPVAANIHYLGGKHYKDLPAYLAGWDVALLPFARNESTRFISPTKTPEYLAAGKPVVSTSIRDVVRPYGQQNLVRIADTVDEFVQAVEAAMNENAEARIKRSDEFLAQTSWDQTWKGMLRLINSKLAAAAARQQPEEASLQLRSVSESPRQQQQQKKKKVRVERVAPTAAVVVAAAAAEAASTTSRVAPATIVAAVAPAAAAARRTSIDKS